MARIAERRRRIGDPTEEKAYGEPWEVLDYLRAHSRDIPPGVRADDVVDGLVLRFHLWWEGEAMEQWLLDSAARAGIALTDVAELLGVGTGSAVTQRRHRLAEKLAGRPPRRKYHPAAVTDPAARQDVPAQAAAAEPGDLRSHWLARNLPHLQRYAAVLVEHKDLPGLADDTYAELLDLRRINRDPGRGAGWIAELAGVTVALLADPAVKALPVEHQLRRTLDRLDALTDEWGALGRAPVGDAQAAHPHRLFPGQATSGDLAWSAGAISGDRP